MGEIGLFGVLILAFGVVVMVMTPGHKRRKARGKRREASGWGLSDPKVQMEAVGAVGFERKRLLNASEMRVFRALEAIVAEAAPDHRVMAQVSLGEVIGPCKGDADGVARRKAFASINSKRLDLAVVDPEGFVALAVEYQGGGHHQGKAFMRDAVKKEALRRAGVAFLEVEKGTKPSEFALRVRNALGVAEGVAAE